MSSLIVLQFINEIIEDQNGVPVYPGDPIGKSELDSFGYTVFFFELEEEYDVDLYDDIIANGNIQTKVDEIIKAILERSDEPEKI